MRSMVEGSGLCPSTALRAVPPRTGEEFVTSWKVTLPCTKAEAEALADDIAPLAWLDSPPVLMTSEADALGRTLAARRLFRGASRRATIARAAARAGAERGGRRAGGRAGRGQDWVTLSQQGLEPIRAGRFFVHTPAHRGRGAGRRRSRSRSTPAAPSAPASTRPPPAAWSRSTGSRRAARASPTSSTSAPAPACSPSRRCGCGRGAGDRVGHRSGRDRGHARRMRRSTDVRLGPRAAASSSWSSPPGSTIRGCRRARPTT